MYFQTIIATNIWQNSKKNSQKDCKDFARTVDSNPVTLIK